MDNLFPFLELDFRRDKCPAAGNEE